MKNTTSLILLVTTCLLSFTTLADNTKADTPAIIRYNSIHHPVIAPNGMVVTQNALATEVGIEILKQGGNAIDSAIATAFALAVTLPRAGNIGGGGFMVVHIAETDEQFAIDYRELAPELATSDMYLDANGDVDKQKAWFSHQSAGVPGTVAGMYMAWEKWGSLKWKKLLAPAIRLAGKGMPVSYDLATNLGNRLERLSKNPITKQYLYKEDGSSYQQGEIMHQRDLARTLKQIARKGPAGFYEGKVADLIVADMQANDGLINHKDLKDYKPILRKVISGDFSVENDTYEIVSMPPPSSGGIHLVQMLNTLEHLPLKEAGRNSAEGIHLMVEAMRIAYADRSAHLGDPDFYDVPIEFLTSESYGKQIADGINQTSARKSVDVAPVTIAKKESPDTTHFSVVDKFGNAVSNTYTLNFSYGSGIMVKGAGFMLNNEMDDFSAKPGVPNAYGLVGTEANKVEANKRPLSSMTPTIVFKKNAQGGKDLFLVTGSPGGSRIITAVLQNILNVTVHGLNVAEATHAPRMHHQWVPDQVFVEPGISADTIDDLKEMGHKIRKVNTMGSIQAIQVIGGYKYGAADPRRPDAKALGH